MRQTPRIIEDRLQSHNFLQSSRWSPGRSVSASLCGPILTDEVPLKQVLGTMARQAQHDLLLEELKLLIPAPFGLDDIFAELDYMNKGFVSLSDLRGLFGEFGSCITFEGCYAIAREARLRRPLRNEATLGAELAFTDLAALVLPATDESAAVLEAYSDDEAKSVLYVLQHTDPCPYCGLRTQRSSAAAGCPSVTCPACRTAFRCFALGSDRASLPQPLSLSCRYQVFRLLSQWLVSAEDMENDRRLLRDSLTRNLLGLCDVFGYLSAGRLTIEKQDLWNAFWSSGLMPSEPEFSLLWRHYSRVIGGICAMTFPDFRTQLQPCL